MSHHNLHFTFQSSQKKTKRNIIGEDQIKPLVLCSLEWNGCLANPTPNTDLVVGKIQKQIVEPIKVIQQERITQRIFENTYLFLGENVDVVHIMCRAHSNNSLFSSNPSDNLAKEMTHDLEESLAEEGDDTRFGR